MALLDRFRSLPANKHPDAEVRLAHIEALPIDEREQLVSAVLEDESPRVRRAAVGKLIDPVVLGSVARNDADAGVRAQASAMLRDIALEAFEGIGEAESLGAIDALTDSRIIAQIAKTATTEAVARHALGRIGEPHMVGSIARHAALESIRRAALGSLGDREEIVAVAMNSDFKDTAVAALEQLTDRKELEQVANRSTNKSASKRARAILRELDERAALEAPAAAPAVEPPLPPVETAPALPVQPWDAASGEAAGPAEDALTESERARQDAEAARLRSELEAADRAAAQAEIEALAIKEAARRGARLLELVDELEAAAGDADLRSAKRRIGLVEREWRALVADEAIDADMAARYAVAGTRFSTRQAEAREADARARQDALKRLQQLLDRVEALAAAPEVSTKAADRALREIRAALATLPRLPSKSDYEEVTRRLKAAQRALSPRLQELRALEDWQRWANVGIQEALCEKMEALKSADDPEEIARRIHDLQQQWRQAADVPRAQGEALWRRFKAAHDEVWPRCAAHFAAEAERRAGNLASKVALCERVEALADSTHWVQTAEEIKGLQAEWKTIGPVSRGQEKAIWERFRAACDRFFTRRHEDLARRKAVWAENLAKKEALCEKAEALADSTDWDPAAAELRRLQGEWRTIGPVKKTRSEAVWQRFRGACDRFFLRYAQRHEIARGERAAAREALCAELEALAASTDTSTAGFASEPPPDLPSQVRSLRSRWQQEVARRGVDSARAVALEHRFSRALDRVIAGWPAAFTGTEFDAGANRQRMEAIVQRIENVASSLGAAAPGSGDAISPTVRLAAMLKEALAANTIGGKVDDDSRLRAVQEDLRQAQAAWARIGPVQEAVRRPLEDRFQRAAQRIAERVRRVGAAGGAGRLETEKAGR